MDARAAGDRSILKMLWGGDLNEMVYFSKNDDVCLDPTRTEQLSGVMVCGQRWLTAC
jgi:hypothetical protein